MIIRCEKCGTEYYRDDRRYARGLRGARMKDDCTDPTFTVKA